MDHASLGRCTSKNGIHAFVENEVGEPNLLEEMEVDAPFDAHLDTYSDVVRQQSPFRSTLVLKEENLSDAQNADFEEKSRQTEDIISKKTTKRSKRTRTKRNDSDDDNEDEEKDDDVEFDHKAMLSSADRKIQVGDDFQAHVGELQKEHDDTLTNGEREHVLWCPPADIDEISLNQYCEYAAEKYRLAEDQALYLLQKSSFDFNVAQEKVGRRRPINEEWGEDDRALFKQALLMFGKRFDKIHQMMPYRSMSSIVQFYYNTKKDHDYKSLIDTRMAEDSEDDDSADDQDNDTNVCSNCSEECRQVHVLDDMQLCFVCWTYFRFLGKHRPCNFLSTVKEIRQRKRKCPRDMLDIAHSFVEMSTYVDHKIVPDDENVIDGMEIVEMSKTKCHEEMKAVMCELAKVRASAIRLEHSMKSQRSEGLTDGLESYRYLTISDKKDEEGFSMKLDKIKLCESWSEEERMVAFRCLLRYEDDFDAVSEVVGTKTPDQVKSFYMEVRSDVDKVLQKLAPFVPEMSDTCAP
ncbi:hypothetical protein Angca_007814 [Angiostrongylus cantonensis]|nr:hypothetical protein Angca_007814 [Angiostrongylus cantonensis]